MGSKFEKMVIIDGKVYEYIAKREMTDEETKRYYDQFNKNGLNISFLISLQFYTSALFEQIKQKILIGLKKKKDSC